MSQLVSRETRSKGWDAKGWQPWIFILVHLPNPGLAAPRLAGCRARSPEGTDFWSPSSPLREEKKKTDGPRSKEEEEGCVVGPILGQIQSGRPVRAPVRRRPHDPYREATRAVDESDLTTFAWTPPPFSVHFFLCFLESRLFIWAAESGVFYEVGVEHRHGNWRAACLAFGGVEKNYAKLLGRVEKKTRGIGRP